jgi:hypothetical protein
VRGVPGGVLGSLKRRRKMRLNESLPRSTVESLLSLMDECGVEKAAIVQPIIYLYDHSCEPALWDGGVRLAKTVPLPLLQMCTMSCVSTRPVSRYFTSHNPPPQLGSGLTLWTSNRQC